MEFKLFGNKGRAIFSKLVNAPNPRLRFSGEERDSLME
jgi:hypothetical protein